MGYQIKQDYEYMGNDRWKWSAWIGATAELLEQIDYVQWILHPTFSPSQIKITDKDSCFKLSTSGWGTFRLQAELYDKNGASLKKLSRMLELDYPDESTPVDSKNTPEALESPVSDKNKSRYVYMSFASQDSHQASAIRGVVENLGVSVRDVSEIAPGQPVDAAVRKLIRESAGVMTVSGSDYVSPSVVSEIQMARAEGKSVFPMFPNGVERPEELPVSIRDVRFAGDTEDLEPLLADFVANLGANTES